MISKTILHCTKYICIFFIVNSYTFAQTPPDSDLFSGIIQQSSDYTCGPAALATLFQGTVKGSNITEFDVIRTKTTGDNKTGFSLQDMVIAARYFGHDAEWRKISKDNLSRISEPVILLIGLNSMYPHYVVFKGIIESEAYLADPIRGNIRLPYEELSKEGLSSKYPNWYVMAIGYEDSRLKTSPLYISNDKSKIDRKHYTVNQSNAITMLSISKSGQIILEHSIGFSNTLIELNELELKSHDIINNLVLRYGVSQYIELGGEIDFIDSYQSINFNSETASFYSNNRKFQLFLNYKQSLESSIDVDNGLMFRFSLSRSLSYNDFGIDLSIFGYHQNAFGQTALGGKLFQQLHSINEESKQQTLSIIASYNRPLTSSSVFALTGSMDREINDNIYTIDSSFSLIFSKNIQLTPSFAYTFGDKTGFTIGLTTSYIGDW